MSSTFAYGWYVVNYKSGEAEGPYTPREADEKRLDLVMASPERHNPYEVWVRDRNGEFRRSSF